MFSIFLLCLSMLAWTLHTRVFHNCYIADERNIPFPYIFQHHRPTLSVIREIEFLMFVRSCSRRTYFREDIRSTFIKFMLNFRNSSIVCFIVWFQAVCSNLIIGATFRLAARVACSSHSK